MRTNRLAMQVAGVALAVSFLTPVAVAGPILSEVDTMRIVDAMAGAGDTVAVDFYIRNEDTLGAYVFRIRYDPSLIEPLTDTVVLGVDTSYVPHVTQLRGSAFDQFQGNVPEPGVMAFVAVDVDADTLDLFLPGTGPAARMQWHVLTSATPQTTTIVFENDPEYPQSHNNMTDLWGERWILPILKTGIFTIDGPTCDCPFQGDAEPEGFITALDLGACIDILFGGANDIQEPLCPSPRFDLDCDGFTTTLDLSYLTDYLFAAGPGPCDPCAD